MPDKIRTIKPATRHYGNSSGYDWSHDVAFTDPFELIGRSEKKKKENREKYQKSKGKSKRTLNTMTMKNRFKKSA